jgi:hypothetical protein
MNARWYHDIEDSQLKMKHIKKREKSLKSTSQSPFAQEVIETNNLTFENENEEVKEVFSN